MQKIALTGAHGVGKTTLIKSLNTKYKLSNKKISFTPEVPRIICEVVSDNTFFRRGNNTFEKQATILFGQATIEQKLSNCEILFCDRTIIDHWAYTKYFFEEQMKKSNIYLALEGFILEYLASYDEILYVPIEFLLEDDGTREGDIDFQKDIDLIIQECYKKAEVIPTKITGTIEQRLNIINKIINNNETK